LLRQHTSKRIVLIVVLASLLSHSIVQACEPIEPTILVKCSNLETAILANQQVEAGDTREDIKRRQANNTVDNLLAIIPNCAEDLVPVVDIFEQEIIKWLDHENKRGAFLDRNLVLEPYATDRYSQLQKNKNSLLSCSYEEFRHHDDWLISFETNRPYCGLFGITPGACPNVILSSGQFLVYLVTNININTIPYMIGLLLTGAAMVGVWLILLENQIVMHWRNIFILSIALLPIGLLLIMPPVWIVAQIGGWILIFYILALWYKLWEATHVVSRNYQRS
jgi:hypothetical protein